MIKIDIEKKLGEFNLNAKLNINEGDFVALYGPSGSGKTTLLRAIAGFIKPDSGLIIYGENIFFDDKKRLFLSPQKRDIGYLFQDYALFPNMSVLKNLLYAKNDFKMAEELLNMMELADLINRDIPSLSGGQKQRVALARALMRRPKILLLDEPLSALDANIRAQLQNYLAQIHKKYKMTVILVSHDAGEIYKLAGRVYEMKKGSIIAEGPASQILLKPSGSQKFSLNARILEIIKKDAIYIAVIDCYGSLAEVVLSGEEAKILKPGDEVMASAKAFRISLKRDFNQSGDGDINLNGDLKIQVPTEMR